MKTKTDVLVIGGGQAGLCVGYYLAQKNESFLIVDAEKKVGNAWRKRYDNLKLLTPNRENSLPGLSIEGKASKFPTKNEFADYLESYSRHFKLPIKNSIEIKSLRKNRSLFVAKHTRGSIYAKKVIVATGPFQKPSTPAIPGTNSLSTFQLHTFFYKNSKGFPEGKTLVVGAGDSGIQIAQEISRKNIVTLSSSRKFVFKNRYDFLYNIALGILGPENTRKLVALLGIKRVNSSGLEEFLKKGKIVLKPKLVKINKNKFYFSDGTFGMFDNVVWATGYTLDYSWIKIADIFNQIGLYFVYPRKDYGFIRDLAPKAKRIVELIDG